jgi:hypothetical protein
MLLEYTYFWFSIIYNENYNTFKIASEIFTCLLIFIISKLCVFYDLLSDKLRPINPVVKQYEILDLILL